MGLGIKKNKKGLYQVQSSTSDNLLHDGWLTEDEVKKLLIEKAYQDFVHTTIEIDMEFPNDYYINGKIYQKENLHQAGKIFVIKNWGKPEITEKFNKICERLKIKQ